MHFVHLHGCVRRCVTSSKASFTTTFIKELLEYLLSLKNLQLICPCGRGKWVCPPGDDLTWVNRSFPATFILLIFLLSLFVEEIDIEVTTVAPGTAHLVGVSTTSLDQSGRENHIHFYGPSRYLHSLMSYELKVTFWHFLPLQWHPATPIWGACQPRHDLLSHQYC